MPRRPAIALLSATAGLVLLACALHPGGSAGQPGATAAAHDTGIAGDAVATETANETAPLRNARGAGRTDTDMPRWHRFLPGMIR